MTALAETAADYSARELLIATIADLLDGLPQVAQVAQSLAYVN